MSTHSRTDSDYSAAHVTSGLSDKMKVFNSQPQHHSHSRKTSSHFHPNPPFRSNSSKLPKNPSLRHPHSTNVPKSVSNPSYECSHCPYSTDRKNNLKRHLATMHEASAKSLECCELRFVSKSSLRDHVNKCHAQGAGYACASCGRRFSRKALMRRHATVHNGERPHACPSCEYATSHRSNLDRHVRRHQLLDGSVRRRCCDQAAVYKANMGFAKRGHYGNGVWNQVQEPSKKDSFFEQHSFNDNKSKHKSARENPLQYGNFTTNEDLYQIDENSNTFKTTCSKATDSVSNVSRADCNGFPEEPARCDVRDKLAIIRRLGRVKKQQNIIDSGNIINRANFQSRYGNNKNVNITEQDFVKQMKEMNAMTPSWIMSSGFSPFSFLYDSYLRYFMPSPASWPLLQMNPNFPVNNAQLFEQTFQRSSKNMDLFRDVSFKQSSGENCSERTDEQNEDLKVAPLNYFTLQENKIAQKRFSVDNTPIKSEMNTASPSHLQRISSVGNNAPVRPSSERNENIDNCVLLQSDSVLMSSLDGAAVDKLKENESIVADDIIRSRPRMRLAPECHRCSVCNVAFRNQMESELHEEQLHR